MNALTHAWLKEITLGLFVALFSTLQAQIATLPFELEENGHVMVELHVNDHPEKLRFVLDTGATADLLDKATAKKLGIESNFQQSTTGASGSEVYDIAIGQQLRLAPNVQIDNSNLVLMDLSELKSRSDKPFDGIVGNSLFSKYVSIIDFENEKLILYEHIQDIDLDGFTTLPFEFDNFIPIPQFEIELVLNNGEKIKGKVLYDSGAGLSFLFNTPFAKEHQVVQKSDKSIQSDMSGGLTSTKIKEESILIESLTLGEYTFESVVARVPDSKSGVSSFEGYAGLLGAQIAKRFTTVIDYANKEIHLKPNAFFDDPFRRPLSGIALHEKGGVPTVYSVVSTSMAFKKGLRAGDRIVSIDKISSEDIEQYRKLLRQEGKKVKIKAISEDGTEKTVSIRLESLL